MQSLIVEEYVGKLTREREEAARRAPHAILRAAELSSSHQSLTWESSRMSVGRHSLRLSGELCLAVGSWLVRQAGELSTG